MEIRPLSARQIALLEAIRDWRRPFPPTTGELGTRFGVSTQAIRQQLLVLRGRFLVTWLRGQPRTLLITDEGRELLEQRP